MSAKGWDYVVIGAGAAGCVVAGRLSEMLPAARIALIEAGRERLGLTTKVPGIAFIVSHVCPAKLELPDGAGAGAKRPPSIVVSGPHSRRLEQHQRHALSARPFA